jgi:excisionase family DNA binding protein
MMTKQVPPPRLEPVAVGVEQAARMLAIPRTAVFRLLRAGALKSMKIGRRRVIRVEELHRFAAAAEREVAA